MEPLISLALCLAVRTIPNTSSWLESSAREQSCTPDTFPRAAGFLPVLSSDAFFFFLLDTILMDYYAD